MALTQIPIELSSTPGIVDNSNATAITIDSSENVLVGTTDAAPGVGNTNTGGAFGSNGYGVFSRTGSAAQATAYFNKNTNDGTIIDLRKDGTTVGSIFSHSSGNMGIGTGDTGVLFAATSETLQPWNTSTNAVRDAAIDLGVNGGRFKDLYLSGGAYLGGTAAANKLDDYEEGTWTPSGYSGWATNPTSVSATYTKIGRFVMLNVAITGGSFNNQCYLTGVPFNESFEGTAPVVNGAISVSATAFVASTDRIWFSATNGTNSDGSRFSIVYETSE